MGVVTGGALGLVVPHGNLAVGHGGGLAGVGVDVQAEAVVALVAVHVANHGFAVGERGQVGQAVLFGGHGALGVSGVLEVGVGHVGPLVQDGHGSNGASAGGHDHVQVGVVVLVAELEVGAGPVDAAVAKNVVVVEDVGDLGGIPAPHALAGFPGCIVDAVVPQAGVGDGGQAVVGGPRGRVVGANNTEVGECRAGDLAVLVFADGPVLLEPRVAGVAVVGVPRDGHAVRLRACQDALGVAGAGDECVVRTLGAPPGVAPLEAVAAPGGRELGLDRVLSAEPVRRVGREVHGLPRAGAAAAEGVLVNLLVGPVAEGGPDRVDREELLDMLGVGGGGSGVRIGKGSQGRPSDSDGGAVGGGGGQLGAFSGGIRGVFGSANDAICFGCVRNFTVGVSRT